MRQGKSSLLVFLAKTVGISRPARTVVKDERSEFILSLDGGRRRLYGTFARFTDFHSEPRACELKAVARDTSSISIVMGTPDLRYRANILAAMRPEDGPSVVGTVSDVPGLLALRRQLKPSILLLDSVLAGRVNSAVTSCLRCGVLFCQQRSTKRKSSRPFALRLTVSFSVRLLLKAHGRLLPSTACALDYRLSAHGLGVRQDRSSCFSH